MISISLSHEEEKLIRKYAKKNGQSVSEYLRNAILAIIEEEANRTIIREYEKAKTEGDIVLYNHTEVWKS